VSKRATIIPLIVLAVAALLFFAINASWTSWFGGRSDQRTDDAYVRADMTPLSTRISGTVRKMDVEDFQRVTAGQVLVEIDPDEYHAIVEQAKAALAASEAALADNQAAKRIQAAKIQSAEAMVTQAEAAVSAARHRCLYAACGRADGASAQTPGGADGFEGHDTAAASIRGCGRRARIGTTRQ
jgi:membrane fusion protein, multidrug efflux system